MDIYEALYTTRAMRRLDPSRPVSRDDIWTIVEMATRAATGGNSQPVRWIVVDVTLAPLAPGDYAVEVKAGDATRTTAFRVVP